MFEHLPASSSDFAWTAEGTRVPIKWGPSVSRNHHPQLVLRPSSQLHSLLTSFGKSSSSSRRCVLLRLSFGEDAPAGEHFVSSCSSSTCEIMTSCYGVDAGVWRVVFLVLTCMISYAPLASPVLARRVPFCYCNVRRAISVRPTSLLCHS